MNAGVAEVVVFGIIDPVEMVRLFTLKKQHFLLIEFYFYTFCQNRQQVA